MRTLVSLQARGSLRARATEGHSASFPVTTLCCPGPGVSVVTLNLLSSKLQTDMKTTNLEEMRVAMETYYEEVRVQTARQPPAQLL